MKPMLIESNEVLPAIEWEFGELLEKDIDERMEVYLANGTDFQGHTYTGSAYFYSGELDEIKDIEETTTHSQ